MDRQLAAGLCVRGWLNPAYSTLGCDPGVSYMAAMGGWGVLDYALNFAPDPFDWLQLGYASYLSSWCLMNTGRAETGYGFWFPGRENDGASGWQFQKAKAGGAWMGSSYPGGVTVPRGPWRYDGEIDLGYGGALRMAATVIAKDPVFGWIAYGGALEDGDRELSVEPRDGLRRRFAAIVPGPGTGGLLRLKIELERDGFAAGRRIVADKSLRKITFSIENRTADTHKAGLRLSAPAGFAYDVVQDGRPVPLVATGDWDYPWRAELDMAGVTSNIELSLSSRRDPAIQGTKGGGTSFEGAKAGEEREVAGVRLWPPDLPLRLGQRDRSHVLGPRLHEHPRALADRRPRRGDVVDEDERSPRDAVRPPHGVGAAGVPLAVGRAQPGLGGRVAGLDERARDDAEAAERGQVAGQETGLIEAAFPPARGMQGHRDEEFRSLPEPRFSGQARGGVAGQRPAEGGVLPVLEEQDDVLERAAVDAAGAVTREGRGRAEAARAEMVPARALVEASAPRARRAAPRGEAGQAGAADDLFTGRFEGFPADMTKGRENEEPGEPGQPGRRGPQTGDHWARSSSSTFSWQSTQ